MTTLAFTDAGGGYYQYESPDGSVPAWAAPMTPCAVQAPAVVTAPLSVTPYQFKAALVQQNLYTQALAAVNAGPLLTQLAWSEALIFTETDPLIVSMATTLGQTTDQVHALFQLAGTLAP